MNHEALQYEYLLKSESPSTEEYMSNLLIPLGPPTSSGRHQNKKNLLYISGPNELDEVYAATTRDAWEVDGPEDLPFALGLGFRRDRSFQKTAQGFSIHYVSREGHDLGELTCSGRLVSLKQNLLDPNQVELHIRASGSEMARLINVDLPLPTPWRDHFQSRLSQFGNVHFHPDNEHDIHFVFYPAIFLVSGLIPLRIETLDRLVILLRDLAFDPCRTFQMPAVTLRLYYQAVNYVLGRPEQPHEEEVCQAAVAHEIAAGVIPAEWPKLETAADGSKAVTCRRLLPVMGFNACLRDIEPFMDKLASGGFIQREKLPCPDFLSQSLDSNTQTEDQYWSTLPLAAHIAMAPLNISPKVRILSARDNVVSSYFCTRLDLNERESASEFRTPEDYGRVLALTKIWKAQCLRLREEATNLLLKQINSPGGCHEIQ